MKEVKINDEFIKLDQFLKYISIAGTGGHAKYLISEGHIEVNGHVVLQRGKKIRPGDTVRIQIEEEHIFKTFKVIKD